MASTCDASFDDGSGTKSKYGESAHAPPPMLRISRSLERRSWLSLTCTSFSPRETRLTILLLATLSGLELRWYSASSIA